MGRNAIEARGLGKRYSLGEEFHGDLREALYAAGRRLRGQRRERKEIWPLRGIDLDIPEGARFGIVGRNGAGKSTLLKLFARITEPTEGSVRMRGRVGSLLEVGTGFHHQLTGRENVYLSGAIHGLRKRDVARRFDEIVGFSGIGQFIDTPVKRYSSGMYMRLAFAVAAHIEPDILVVDEVLAVGDAEFQRRCLTRMSGIADEGRTVVFVSHDLDAVARLCDTAIWLDGGPIREQGPAPLIIDRYLGSTGARSSQRMWEEPAGDGPVRLRAVAVEGSKVLRALEPVSLRMELEVREQVSRLDLGVLLNNLRGVSVYARAISEDHGALELGPGRHAVTVQVPPGISVGDYLVSIWIGTRHDNWVWEQDVLQLRLEGTAPSTERVIDMPAVWTSTAVPES